MEATATLPSKTQHPYSQHCLHGLMWYAYLRTCAVQKQLWSQLLETTVGLCPKLDKDGKEHFQLGYIEAMCMRKKDIMYEMKFKSIDLQPMIHRWSDMAEKKKEKPFDATTKAKICQVPLLNLIYQPDIIWRYFSLIVVALCHWPNWSLWGCQPLWPWLLITLILDKQIEISALKIINTKALI